MKKIYIKPEICSNLMLTGFSFMDLVSSQQINELELVEDSWD